ncbi:MAG: thioesterase [Oscillochloris sp.]|nr:thioesterase [Oscillochloris sp.]
MISSETWITCPRPSPQAAVRLFCFPYAGGAASIFTSWTVALPASIEVCPVQYPGRGSRMSDPALTAIQSLAQGLLPVIRTLLDRPFAFFGHSMGALVSFELVRLLQLEGKVPAQIFASAHRAPQLPDPDPPLHQLPTPELIDQLRQLNGTPPEVLDHAELLELMLPMLRADFAACETYQYVPGPSLTCPLTAFGGLRDMHITREMLDAWRIHTSGPFAVRMFPGDHFFLNSDRQLLLAAIARDLSQRVRLNAGAQGAS